MKIVLANSIGIDSRGYYVIHSPSRWSEGVKNRDSWFTYYPWELAYCSSLLKKNIGHEVKFVDGCLEHLNYRQYLEKIKKEEPDWLVIEGASRTFDEYIRMANELKKQFGTRIVFTGHHASAFPGDVLSRGADYACIGEYEYTVLELMQGKDPRDIKGLFPNKRRPLLDINSLPWPEDEDVSRLSYGIPGEPSSEYLEIQMYASRGCPRSCDFCVARNLYYAQPNWRQRSVADIVNELKYLKNKYPRMEGVFFDEEEHNVSKDFILRLTQGIIDNGLDRLHYEAMCDIRTLDKEMMTAMRDAGYYKIRVGIETVNKDVLSRSNKNVDISDISRKLETAKEAGLKTYGTFMIGMPGSSKETDLGTASYIEKMVLNGLLDNVQISICTPQPGTPFYEFARSKNYIITDDYSRFDGGLTSVISYPGYKAKSIEAVKNFAYRTREHASFLRNFRRGEMLKWTFKTYKRYGFFITIAKLVKRFGLEARHYFLSRMYKRGIEAGGFDHGVKTGPHILNIVQRYYPSIGGAEMYMRELSERLVRDGYKVTVFTTDAWDLEHFWKRRKRRINIPKENINGVEVERFRAIKFPFHNFIMRVFYNAPFLFSKSLFSLPSPVVFGMWKELFFRNRKDFTAVHVSALPYNSLVYMGIRYAGTRGIPVIATPFLHLGECKNDKVNRYYTRNFQIKLLSECDKIIVQTIIEKDFLKSAGIDDKKIYVIGQGVNIEDIKGGNGVRFRDKFGIRERKIVFHVSTKSYDKGTFHLVEAMKKIWNKDEDVKLILAGPPMDEFNRYFAAQDGFVKSKTLILDYVIGDDKKDLFKAGDVFVLPSRTDSYGAVFLEAWVNKKPVIGARAGGVSEVIKDSEDGYLVKFGNVPEISGRIQALLSDEILAKNMGDKGFLKVSDGLTWDDRYIALKSLFNF
jgi:glycosyltransferase involved in cell wall biosynthesis/radical SAM superfamily enzyme YgiQ (UPF0313 family)